MPNRSHKLKNAAVPLPATLAETQALFQKAVLDGDDTILAALCDNSRTTRTTLFGVYRNAYSARLAEILGNDYPYLAAYLGPDRFAELASAYIAAHPSTTPNARWFGANLPEFLRSVQTHEANPEYADLAALENALSHAFDAADAPLLSFEALAAYPAEDWGRLVFDAHPSATLLQVESDVLPLWRSLKDDKEPSQPLRQDGYLIVWRNGATPFVRAMPDEEAMLWIEAGRGTRFEALCELCATFDDPDTAAARAAGYLQGWLSSDMLTRARLA